MGMPGQLHGIMNKHLGDLVRCPKCGNNFRAAELQILNLKVIWKKCPNPKCNYIIPPKLISIK